MPSPPPATACSAAVFVTMLNTTSLACATARGDSPHFIPASTSHCAFAGVRL